ncbi:MAG: phosphomannomutase/phosphoglucomutase, partial [Gammaproteobacteria bacterium]
MAGANGKKTRSKSAGRSQPKATNAIWNHALIAIGLSVIGVVCMAGLVWWQIIMSGNDAHRDDQIALISNTYVGHFNGRVQEIRTRTQALAASQEVIDALIGADPLELDRLSGELTAQHGLARRIQLIPKGSAQTDNDPTAPISFAALDLISRAERSPLAGPEISKAQDTLLMVAAPIQNQGITLGVLFIAFDRQAVLTDALAGLGSTVEYGQVKILQDISGSGPTEVFAFGTPGTATNRVQAPLAVPYWTMVFEPNLEAFSPASQITRLITATAVLLCFVLAGISLAFSSLSRKLEQDAETLGTYLGQLLKGRSPGLDRYRLPMFQRLAIDAAKLGANRKTMSDTPDKPPQPAPPEPKTAAPKPTEEPPAPPPADDLLDNDEESFLEVNVADDAAENFGIQVEEDVGPVELGLNLSADIFRAYDIRGITTRNLTEDVVYWIGRAFAAEAQSNERDRVVVGRDGRHSSAPLRDALARGLTEGGCDVIDIGEVPTPLLYFATHALDTGTGVMITGSHNPPDYNGLKMMIAGETLAEDRIQALKRRIEENQLSDGSGEIEEMDLTDHYLDRALESVVVAQPCKVVVDCGNGVAGHLAPRLIEELGCEVVPLYCNVDGDFPNHHPDPAEPENLQDLIEVVKDEQAALGLAFDGDGDRLGVVTPSGDIIWPDKLLMLFAQDIVGRNPGADIIYDVKCSRHLNNLISEYGGRPIMWRTGHSHMKAKLKETGALLAGEFSGHICFAERWYGFDDALYSAARLLEIIGAENKSVDEL